MTKHKPTKKAKRMPNYSSDSLIIHLVIGLLLIALGVLIFLAVVIRMSGDIFSGLRSVCFGLTGSLTVLLAVFPFWAGVLVIWASQRRAPVLPFLLGLGLYMLALACANLFTFTGVPSQSLLDYFCTTSNFSSAYDLFLAKAYAFGTDHQVGGGLLGMIPAWPLWKLAGPIPAGVICILLAIVDFLFLIRFDAAGTFQKLKAHDAARRAQDQQQQAQLRQQELAWQQNRAAQAMAQGQAYQQQAQPYPQQQPYYQNQPYGGMPQQPQQQPIYAEVQPDPRTHGKKNADQPAFGFQPTEEELRGVPGAKKRSLKDLFLGTSANDGEEKPARMRRKGIFDVDEPTEKPARTPLFARSRKDAEPDYPQEQPPVRQDENAQPAADPQADYQWTPPQINWQGPADEPEPQPEPAADPVKTRSTWRHEVPVQPAQPAKAQPANSWRAQVEQKMAAMDTPQPAAEETAKAVPSRRRSAWKEETGKQRTSTWRGNTDEPASTPSRQPSRTASGVQQPKPSWSDDSERPPWEEPIAPPEELRVPVVQQAGPKNGWQPDLDLAPVKHDEDRLGWSDDPDPIEIPYVYPELDLLKLPEPPVGQGAEEDAVRSQRLEETLASFKVTAKVRHVTHGPAISRFELELAAGIKVSKVTDLAQNIAMNMEVKSVRIEAPIPGKSLVGVEVPNRKTSTVTLREIMESDAMRNASNRPLVVALGKDIAGTPIVCDLAKMPHLLIAGATGSGKSVCINTMINSLLYRCSPKEVRMILVDPKVVELQCYNGVPHLLMPVVSDPHKAAGALAWAVAEMMDRYQKFQIKGVRAIDGYNAALEDGDERMPRIVIIIDELADLMMTCKRDVEDHICRLAQLARAAGIHLVVATQRPSVDVITGLIKANIPSRIAFKVSSFIDSRTILDKMGAEQLLGYGDMLYQPTGEFTPIRIQGCFLSDNEVNRITDFIRENSPANYDPSVMEQVERLTDNGDGGTTPDMAEMMDASGGDGSLLAQCIEMAVNDGQVSTSLIQRRLKIGYARAGRLVDEMEKRGIVSQKDGAKPRMCLLSREEYERMKDSGELDD